MEQDRYQQNHFLFIVGMIALLIALAFMSFTAYVLPYLLFHWQYDIPDFIIRIQAWFTYTYPISDARARLYIFLILLGQLIFFGIIAYYVSNRIDDEIYGIDHKMSIRKMTDDFKESVRIFARILFYVILIIIAAGILHWLIETP